MNKLNELKCKDSYKKEIKGNIYKVIEEEDKKLVKLEVIKYVVY